eukprot:10301-Eustigmatos_ZCMA.PRE.1
MRAALPGYQWHDMLDCLMTTTCTDACGRRYRVRQYVTSPPVGSSLQPTAALCTGCTHKIASHVCFFVRPTERPFPGALTRE